MGQEQIDLLTLARQAGGVDYTPPKPVDLVSIATQAGGTRVTPSTPRQPVDLVGLARRAGGTEYKPLDILTLARESGGTPLAAAQEPKPTRRGNPFLRAPWNFTDGGQAPSGETFLGRVRDVGLNALQRGRDVLIAGQEGVIGTLEAGIGLAELVSIAGPGASPITVAKRVAGIPQPSVGKEFEQIGITPRQWRETLQSFYSEQQQKANRTVKESKGLVDTVVKAVQNPSVILNAVIQSAPLMLGGAGIARAAIRAGAPMAVAGGIGEGAITAGSIAEQMRQESETGLLTPKQAAIATGAGVVTGGLGALGGRIASWLKIPDIDTLFAVAATDQTARTNIVKGIIFGAFQEGVLEELPQSVQEQIATNWAQKRPWHEGVDEAAVLGAFAGAVMGSGAQVIRAAVLTQEAAPEPQIRTAVPPEAAAIRQAVVAPEPARAVPTVVPAPAAVPLQAVIAPATPLVQADVTQIDTAAAVEAPAAPTPVSEVVTSPTAPAPRPVEEPPGDLVYHGTNEALTEIRAGSYFGSKDEAAMWAQTRAAQHGGTAHVYAVDRSQVEATAAEAMPEGAYRSGVVFPAVDVTAAAIAPSRAAAEEEVSSAAQEGQVEEGARPERPRDDQRGAPTEAGGRGGVPPATGVAPAAQGERPGERVAQETAIETRGDTTLYRVDDDRGGFIVRTSNAEVQSAVWYPDEKAARKVLDQRARPVALKPPETVTGQQRRPTEAVAPPADSATPNAQSAKVDVPAEQRVERLYPVFRAMVQEHTLPKDPRELRTIAQSFVGGDPTTYTDDITDAVEAALTANVASGEVPFRTRLAEAQTLEAQLPRAARSLEKTDLQQFSTPLPLAVAAQHAADIRPDDTVLEPTAGTGHLISTLDPTTANVLAAELSPRRARLLRALGYNVSEGDYLKNLDLKEWATVIVTNPPWGKYSTGKYGTPVGLKFTPGDVAERFVAKNVRDLQSDGRLVAVMPTTILGSSGMSFRTWMAAQGRIVGLVKSPPHAYRTRSTDVESVLLVFDKGQGGFVTSIPALVEPADWEAYATAIEAIPPREAKAADVEPERPAQQPTRGQPAGAPAAGPGALGGRTSRPAEPGQPGVSGERGTPVVPAGRDAELVAGESSRERGELEPERAAPRAAQPDPGESTRGLSPDALKSYRRARDSQFFAPYRLRSTVAGVRHPKLVVEARNLAGVDYPPLTLAPTPRVARLVAAGRASIEQAEQAMAAVQANIEGHHGYLAADNVGVGKSREIALTIIDLMERAKADGRPLRLLVTTKTADNVNDLIDKELRDAILEGEPPGFEIVRVATMKASKTRAADAKYEPLPQYEHAIYVTDFYNFAPFRLALQDVGLHGVIGDEAHRFKNADAAVGGTWQTIHADIMLHQPREQQVFAYFSATPAQSVYDYQYLYGLRLWPVDGFHEWVMVVTGQANAEQAQTVAAATEAGAIAPEAVTESDGLSVVGGDAVDVERDDRPGSEDVFASRLTPSEAEQIPREWKMLGRFSARDLWRAGTEFQVHTATLPQEAKDRYDRFAQLARDIIDAAERFGRMDKSGRSNRFGPKGALQFAAKRIQMQPALEEAIRLAQTGISEGYQPVLSLINVSEMNPNEGNIAAAINQINTRQVETVEGEGFQDVGEIPEALIARAELLEQAQALGVLDDPVEMIGNAFGRDQVAFIVGASAATRQTQAREFQEGTRRVAVISAAGSTGISLDHRAWTSGGVRGRRLFIDVQYEWSASEAVQRYGRVDRAAQLTSPKILALNFGSASEKKFLATVANRMASLGALSKGGAESTGASALEEFEITGQDALEAARNAWAMQSSEDRALWKGRVFRDPRHPERPATMTRASMREINLALLWLPTETANDFWTAFIAERARIREAMGYASDARTKALRGEVVRETRIAEDLTLFEVKNEAGHRFGILQGVVMGKMPRLRGYLYDADGNIKRSYVTFTDTAKDRVVSGLEIPPSRIEGVAAEFGTALRGEAIRTPEQAVSALAAGDTLTLVARSEGSATPWRLRQRKDDKIVIEGAKMADRAILLRHGAAYSPVGNFWHVTDMATFLERFPVAPPKPVEGRAPRGAVQESVGTYTETQTMRTAAIPSRPTTAHPLEFPELIELAQDIGVEVRVRKRFRKAGKTAEFRSGSVRLAAELFQPGNELQLAAAIAHELGHAADIIPRRLMTGRRANLLGRLLSLKTFMRETFTRPDGTEIANATVQEELMRLSNLWRPWNPDKESAAYAAYRASPKELYADAVSVLLRNPGLLEEDAPTFYRTFFESLDKKPEVERAYFDLQELLSGTREELVARRLSRKVEGYERGDAKALELEERRRRDRELTLKNLWFALKDALVSRNYYVIDRVRDMIKRGIFIPDDENPIYMLRELRYLPGKLKGFTERTFAPTYRTLAEHDIPWNMFGVVLQLERVIAGDRSEIANPGGDSPAVAQEQLDAVMRQFTSEQRTVIRDEVTKFRDAVKEVAEAAWQAGLYTDDQHADMMANPAYATFQVIEHLEKNVTSRIYQQIGTTKEITNPATATILKTLVTIRALEYNLAKKGTITTLAQGFPDDIKKAKTAWRGRGMEPVESQDPKEALVTYFEHGKHVGYYVDPYLAQVWERQTVGNMRATEKLLNVFTGAPFFRPLFTTANLGFMSANVHRDFWRAWAAWSAVNPDVPLWKSIPLVAKRYGQAAPLAAARAFGVPEGASHARRAGAQKVIAAEEAGILSVTFNDIVQGETGDTQIEHTLRQLDVAGFNLPKAHGVGRPFHALLQGIKELGDFVETLPKAAAIIEAEATYGSIDAIPASVRDDIRRKIGSPDFLERGSWTPATNRLLLFSNAIIQAWSADYEVMRAPKTRAAFWYKTALVNVLPKALLFAGIIGLGGAALRRYLEKISEYDRTNYIVIPIPLSEDSSGQIWYLRLPQADSGRFLGGVIWKGLQLARGDQAVLETVSQVLDYTAGQLPSIAPIPLAVIATGQMIAGQNPRDWFRGGNVLSMEEHKAGGWIAWEKFIGWEFQQLGGGIIWRFYPGEQQPRRKTVGQKIIELPVLSNIVGRFLRTTNYGEIEALRSAARRAERVEATHRETERSAVYNAVRTYMDQDPAQRTPAQAQLLAFEITAELYQDNPVLGAERLPRIAKRLQESLARGDASPLLDALLAAGSDEQRLAIAQEWERKFAR